MKILPGFLCRKSSPCTWYFDGRAARWRRRGADRAAPSGRSTAGISLFSRTILVSLVMLSCMAPAFANPAGLFRAGNKALAESRFEAAAAAFAEAAAAAPDSAEIHYNLGSAQYRLDDFGAAAQAFEQAASLADSDPLRSRCWYNLGNCMVRTGEALQETDPQAAVGYCRQAAWCYRLALNYEDRFQDAAFNLEMSQMIAAGIEEKIRRQQEEEQKQNELIAYIREKLQEFIDRQSRLMEPGSGGAAQRQLETETRALGKIMETSGLHAAIPLPDGTTAPGPLQETWAHTLKAADAMALPDPPVALQELIAALGAAPEDPNRQDGESEEDSEEAEEYDMEYQESDEEAELYEEADPFGDFSEYEEIRGLPPPNQTEMDILAEEVRNQERRKAKKTGEYMTVEKDW